ncbi:DNA transposase THAP9 [Solea senegalensis]|uniref:DNA transposase THAP9 n=1 Tax=Solea senegalensis TaxID=28829 RepID=A0AAV6PA47_SOLSE|nr:DNA transposase THAP9 [Solea senegalensis]
MPSCAALNCTSRSDSQRPLFCFPLSDRKRLRQWVGNLRRRNWTPNKNSRLCALHFEEGCFTVNYGRKRLTSTAVPTIFNLSMLYKSRSTQEKSRNAQVSFRAPHVVDHMYAKQAAQDGPALLDSDRVVVKQELIDSRDDVGSAVLYHNDKDTKTQSIKITNTATTDTQAVPVSKVSVATSSTLDHTDAARESNITLKRPFELVSLGETLGDRGKRIRLENKLKIRVDSLSQVIGVLKQKNLISSGCAEKLENSFSAVPKTILTRLGRGNMSKVPEELRSFAITLNFYSAKAYAFVRDNFDLFLPLPYTIRKYYSSVSADPGFTRASFSALQTHAEDRKKEGRQTICALMVGEMSICKHVEYSEGNLHGYVDPGCGAIDDSLPPARDAFVVMAVAIDESWKIPLAYFFVDSLTGEERANIITECLLRLQYAGVRTASLTCDGPACHFTMLKTLGVNLEVNSMTPSFPNPADYSQVVHVLLDVCHMTKLLRNTLAEGGLLQTARGDIRWQYIVELSKLQEVEGQRLGDKLKMAHERWEKEKMKVRLATQVFSSSVADALEYCNKHLHLPQFRGCEETVDFLRTIDAALDVLNSRNLLGKRNKKPTKRSNIKSRGNILLKAEEALLALEDERGMPVHSGKRRTCVIGFVASLRSVRSIFHDLVEKPNAPCMFLLTNKLCQDHLELFFFSIRRQVGSDNNPTAKQFTAAYKRLLAKLQVKIGTGNRLIWDDAEIMGATPATVTTMRRFDLKPVEQPRSDHDEPVCPNIDAVSEYKQAAISYMAGFVVKKIKEKHNCIPCAGALTSDSTVHPCFLSKGRGGLQKPSSGVIAVCTEAERSFQRILRTTSGKHRHRSNLASTVSHQVLRYSSGKTLFPQLHRHMFETTVEDNHVHYLVKMASSIYCTMRMNHLAKKD